ncbi:MAG: sensor histidine kinase, partial [Alphaproteobacteria bacterium]|nr:sensor histidine kinase [Alphaproteobacteria bacterium]
MAGVSVSRWALSRFKLKHVLCLCFTIVAAVPVILLGAWAQHATVEAEITAVKDKHALMARNLAEALGRYADDAATVFGIIATSDPADWPGTIPAALLRTLHFKFCLLIDPAGKVLKAVGKSDAGGNAFAVGSSLPTGLIEVIERSRARPETVVFSGVLPDAVDAPTIFLLRPLSADRIAVSAISTEFMVTLHQQIRFGHGGHAAIVDQHGRILAHPFQAWREQRKDISAVAPVARMIKGQSGVTTFYSPAKKADMIAGFTTVPRTGWGVMVPQPMDELIARADTIRLAAVAMVVAGLAIAALLSWWLARRLARPIQATVRANMEVGSGDLATRIEHAAGAAPMEVDQLVLSFNAMAERVKTKNDELAAAARRMEEANRAKSAFLANMSHELRTPLNAILGFSEIIRAQTFGPDAMEKYREYAGDVHDAARMLLELINGVLDMAKAESGKMAISLEDVDLHGLAAECLHMVSQHTAADQVRLENGVPDDFGDVVTDRIKLRQVLLNLLSNGVKFTSAGGQVAIDATRRHDGGVEIRVSDSGIGIAASHLDDVVLPFSRIDTGWTREQEGTGLGLPLSKKLIEAMGGHL